MNPPFEIVGRSDLPPCVHPSLRGEIVLEGKPEATGAHYDASDAMADWLSENGLSPCEGCELWNLSDGFESYQGREVCSECFGVEENKDMAREFQTWNGD